MKEIRRAQAILDIVEIAEFLAGEDFDIAATFLYRVEGSIEMLRRSPKLGTLRNVGQIPDLRMWPVKGFPKILIFYRSTPELFDVLRVVHSARDFYRIFSDE